MPGSGARRKHCCGSASPSGRPFELDGVAPPTIARRPSARIGARLGFTYRGLVGNGDVLNGRFGVTEGVDDNVLSYHVPLNRGRHDARRFAQPTRKRTSSRSRSTTSTSRADLETWSLTASHPFIDASPIARCAASSDSTTSARRARCSAVPFSFSPGDIEGQAQRAAPCRSAPNGRAAARVKRGRSRGVFQVGVDALDATINDVGPDTDFTAFLGQAAVGSQPRLAKQPVARERRIVQDSRTIRCSRCSSCRSADATACAAIA